MKRFFLVQETTEGNITVVSLVEVPEKQKVTYLEAAKEVNLISLFKFLLDIYSF